MYRVLRAGDILMVKTDSDSLNSLIDDGGLEFVESDKEKEKVKDENTEEKAIASDEVSVTEAIIAPESMVRTLGGYKFGDYWRMGLPLSLRVVATAVPLIMRLWPLYR